MKKWQDYDYSHRVYLAARAAAYARSDGHCQLCGDQLQSWQMGGPSLGLANVSR